MIHPYLSAPVGKKNVSQFVESHFIGNQHYSEKQDLPFKIIYFSVSVLKLLVSQLSMILRFYRVKFKMSCPLYQYVILNIFCGIVLVLSCCIVKVLYFLQLLTLLIWQGWLTEDPPKMHERVAFINLILQITQ